jgi:hypothetical protein
MPISMTGLATLQDFPQPGINEMEFSVWQAKVSTH